MTEHFPEKDIASGDLVYFTNEYRIWHSNDYYMMTIPTGTIALVIDYYYDIPLQTSRGFKWHSIKILIGDQIPTIVESGSDYEFFYLIKSIKKINT